MSTPDQWLPKNQDPSVGGVHVDEYGRGFDKDGKQVSGPQSTLQQLADKESKLDEPKAAEPKAEPRAERRPRRDAD